jgi:hypothetical protein
MRVAPTYYSDGGRAAVGRYTCGLWCPSGAGTLGTVRGGHGQGHGGV